MFLSIYLCKLKINYNEIYNATRDPHDAGVIYSWRDFAERGNDIAYNIIHDTDNTGERSATSGTVAIYSDGVMSGNAIHHNILWNNGNPIHHNAGVTNDVSYNMMMKARRKERRKRSAKGGRTWKKK